MYTRQKDLLQGMATSLEGLETVPVTGTILDLLDLALCKTSNHDKLSLTHCPTVSSEGIYETT
jgi:hypothetical protein